MDLVSRLSNGGCGGCSSLIVGLSGQLCGLLKSTDHPSTALLWAEFVRTGMNCRLRRKGLLAGMYRSTTSDYHNPSFFVGSHYTALDRISR